MVRFRDNKREFLEYITRIGNNLPQMVVCSISEVTFDYEVAKAFNNAAKKNKLLDHFSLSDATFKKAILFKTETVNLVIGGILSMGFNYISLTNCELKGCLNNDTRRYLSQEQSSCNLYVRKCFVVFRFCYYS